MRSRLGVSSTACGCSTNLSRPPRRPLGNSGVGRGKVRRAEPDTVLAATGQEVGGVAPVGHPAPLRTIVDEALAAHEVVWAGGGDHHSMFSTTTDELVALTDGTLADAGDDRLRDAV